MDAVVHSDSHKVVGCQTTECQQNYERVTAMHEEEKLSTSSANEHGQRIRVKIPGVNIPEFAESIISVEALAKSSWQRGSSNQVLAKMVKQLSHSLEG